MKINDLRSSVITDKFFDERFFQKAESLNLIFHARLIHDSEINAKTLEHLTKVLVWKIEIEQTT